jgi:hypothetical protein
MLLDKNPTQLQELTHGLRQQVLLAFLLFVLVLVETTRQAVELMVVVVVL